MTKQEFWDAVGESLYQCPFAKDGCNKDCNICLREAFERLERESLNNYDSNNSNAREDFMHIVYNELSDDADNCRANRIIDAADAYADSFDDMVIPSSIRRSVFEIERMTAKRKAQERGE